MSVATFNPSDSIAVSPAAAEHFARQLGKSGAQAVRISLRESGCTGFKYQVDEVQEISAQDMVLTLANGVRVCLAKDALPALRGSQIDYVLEGVNRILKFDNPNVKDACGCGESFSFND